MDKYQERKRLNSTTRAIQIMELLNHHHFFGSESLASQLSGKVNPEDWINLSPSSFASFALCDKQKRVADIVPAIEKARLYRGKAGKNAVRTYFVTVDDKSIGGLISKHILQSSVCSGVFASLEFELKASKDFAKLYAGIAILGYIAFVAYPINHLSFSQLLIVFLGHRYPKIRNVVAELAYLVLLQNKTLTARDKLEKSLKLISETCWEVRTSEAYHLVSRGGGDYLRP
ncbi:hypothetical protein ACFE04_017336 [Oxalis oulophora]